ncbi:MAG: (d)CMP kinase [Gammaproteobacteria bacterium]|nr:MAG: (d)CMP kinase [Gammaproteobacteria bacterium]
MQKELKIITIDGPGGAGKGTIAAMLSQKYGLFLLDSGALYRILALHVMQLGHNITDEKQVYHDAKNIKISFKQENSKVISYLNGVDVSIKIRNEDCAKNASIIAGYKTIREILLQKQRDFASPPGVVADGRDMGSVVFSQAKYKIFITATIMVRAKRRQKQLQNQGENVNIVSLCKQIEERDYRDKNRAVSPLKPATDAFIIDTSAMTIKEVFKKAQNFIEAK